MTRRFVLVLALILVGSAMASMPDWVRLAPLSAPDQAVPFVTVQQVADGRARSLWPDAVEGDVAPMSDIDGRVVAYTFHYRIDGKPFPDYETVAKEIAEEMPALANPANHSRYAYVVASARYDRAPILSYGEGGTEFFVTLERARERAASVVGANPVLTRVYYVWPLSYYEFQSGADAVVLEAHTFVRQSSVEEFFRDVRNSAATAISALGSNAETARVECARKMDAEWNRYLTEAGAFDTTEVFVQDYQLAPFYDWSYGCSPTSGTIVAGYLDIAQGYGRCIYDFFERRDNVEGETDYQVPWAHREMALFFNTDTNSGGTSVYDISPGLSDFGASKGYSWDMFSVPGGYYNDWAWPSDSDEICNGYSMVWSVGFPATQMYHSLAAFGARLETKDMYVHNTWWTPSAWWHYTDGSSQSWTFVSSVHGSGASSHHMILRYPKGDTLYNHTGSGDIVWVGRDCRIRWDYGSVPNDSVNIELSTDGGYAWQSLAHGVHDSGAYHWTPNGVQPTLKARLRLKAFSGGGYEAGDGSYGEFRLVTTPLEPLQLAPPNGRPLTTAPVVLVIDTVQYVDSFNFKLYGGGETLFNVKTLALRCTVPTELFQYNHYYNWVVRAHNSFGWGVWSGPWSFIARLAGVEESARPGLTLALSLEPAVATRRCGVRLQLPEAGEVEVSVFDVAGRPVRTLASRFMPAGVRELAWNRLDNQGRSVAAGCYFVRLSLNKKTLVRKLELVE
jgi:hypothetical protein